MITLLGLDGALYRSVTPGGHVPCMAVCACLKLLYPKHWNVASPGARCSEQMVDNAGHAAMMVGQH